MHALPLLARLLLPLILVVLGAGTLRTALMWQSEVQLAREHTRDFVDDFIHLYGPRMAELTAAGQPDRLEALLQRAVNSHPMLTQLVWNDATGRSFQATRREPVALQVPHWVQGLQSVQGLPGALRAVTLSHPVNHQGHAAGELVLSLSATPELNRIWQSFQQQILVIASVLAGLMMLIPLILRSSLRGLGALSKAASQLPSQPALRIQPEGAREIQQLAGAFNSMAAALQQAHEHARQQLEQTIWVASHDPLTGLPNRTLLADRLLQALRRGERHHEMLAVCFVDLDYFKPINDQHGHTVGDEVLMSAARRMGAELRDTDTLARLGGDEFVVLLTNLQDSPQALAVVERMLASLRRPMVVQGLELRITASVGIALHGEMITPNGDEPPDADLLLRQADQAMYHAKEAGRDQLRVWEPEGPTKLKSQREWLDRMMQAICEGELRLHYQPKVDLRHGHVVGLEALVRWQHPERGLLTPVEFLPQIENTPAIVDIGRWVMEEALSQMDRWRAQGQGWPVSINVAARQILQQDFFAGLGQALARHPLTPPDWLTLEILETSAMDDMVQVHHTVEAVQALGVHCSLDDFGTGYSSLSYLKQLPVHELKIDQSFVRDMLDDTGDLALVQGIISLAQVFSRTLVAEGVETPEHGVLLLRLGCTVAQGWAIAMAMPAEQVASWVQQYQPDPMWSRWADTPWELRDFPLLVAQYDHRRWVNQVLQALDGAALPLPPQELSSHHHCRFGRWYHGHGQAHYGKLPAFKALDPVHQEVHRLGPEILRLRDAGDLAQARAKAHQLIQCRDQILEGIELLHRQVLALPA